MEEPEETPKQAPKSRTQDELAARAAELYKDAKPKIDELVTRARPKVDELVSRAKPKVEEAGKDAARYVREHEGEIKQAASTAARYRLPGPLRLVFEAIRPDRSQSVPMAEKKCSVCDLLNRPTAKFCNECGSRLPSSDSGPDAPKASQH